MYTDKATLTKQWPLASKDSPPPSKRPTASTTAFLRQKTTSAQYVAARARDPTFEKLMEKYKTRPQSDRHTRPYPRHLYPSVSSEPASLRFPRTSSTASPKSFISTVARPHFSGNTPIYSTFSTTPQNWTLQKTALEIFEEEAKAINEPIPLVVQRLVQILAMSPCKTVPLRAIFKVWKELGLPDDFEDSVIAKNPNLFVLDDGNEPNTHVLKLVCDLDKSSLISAVENWRIMECCREDCKVDRTELLYSFKHSFPPGMKLKNSFKAKVEEWQRLPYVGPYEQIPVQGRRSTKYGMKRMEKRAVGIVHEFLSLTVEKMVEVEKISQFRKWFGIDLNIRDLFLDHPGMFYLSTQGKRQTVFLREAYERGCR